MKHKNPLLYAIRYNIKKWAVDFETYRFDREIKRAYRVSYSSFSNLALPEILAERPLLLAAIPITIILLILAISQGPKLKQVSFPSIYPLQKITGFGKAIVLKIRPVKTEMATPIELPIPIQPKPGAKDHLYGLLADKTKKTLLLFNYNQNGRIKPERTYGIMIGQKWGRKQRQGDLKTPEGFYWVINRMERHELPPIYGARAFVLSYPNEQDIAEGRSGTGIWIHGYEDDKKESTKGCLALDRGDLDEITEYIGIGTPILITESAPSPEDSIHKYFTWPTLATRRDSIIAQSRKTESFAATFVERWRVAWESKDIDTYASLYVPDFSQNGMAFPEWKEYKRSIFTRSADISVNVSDIKLMRLNGDTAQIRFTQEYFSGEYRAVNGKMIKIVRMDNDWKIQEEIRM